MSQKDVLFFKQIRIPPEFDWYHHQGASPKPKDTIQNFLAWQEAGMEIMVELTDILYQLDIEDMEGMRDMMHSADMLGLMDMLGIVDMIDWLARQGHPF